MIQYRLVMPLFQSSLKLIFLAFFFALISFPKKRESGATREAGAKRHFVKIGWLNAKTDVQYFKRPFWYIQVWF
jgi:hypothetical protein